MTKKGQDIPGLHKTPDRYLAGDGRRARTISMIHGLVVPLVWFCTSGPANIIFLGSRPPGDILESLDANTSRLHEACI